MHDQQHRPALRQPAHGGHDLGLGGTVQGGRRLVQQQHGPVGEERPGQGQPLTLTGGQTTAALPEHGRRTLGQRLHERQRARVPQRPPYGLVVGFGPRQPYVLGDGAGVQVRMLRHPGDAGVPLFQVEVVEVAAPDADASPGGAHETEQGVEKRGLARSARTDQGDRLPGFDGEAHVRHGIRGTSGIADGHAFVRQGAAGRHAPARRRSPPRRRVPRPPRGTGRPPAAVADMPRARAPARPSRRRGPCRRGRAACRW